MKRIIYLVFLIPLIFIFLGCPLILEPISNTPTIELSDFSKEVKTGEEIALTSTILDVYNKKEETNWYFIFYFNEVPNSVEVLIGEKNENLSRNNFYFVRTEKNGRDGYSRIKFNYKKSGEYTFTVNIC